MRTPDRCGASNKSRMVGKQETMFLVAKYNPSLAENFVFSLSHAPVSWCSGFWALLRRGLLSRSDARRKVVRNG